jgi:peptidoglycan/xylan/chitin deacetylase (PgdA/CDA1 family)
MPERADDSAGWRVRRAMKVAVAGALCTAGARWLVRSVARRVAGGTRVLILSYHLPTRDFAADAARVLPSLLVSAATLKRQLEQLAREREIVTLEEACHLLDAPAAPPSRRASAPDVVVVTFDDGYVGVREEALPILQHLKVPAVVYVASGFIGTSRRLLHDRLFTTLGELWRRRLLPQAAGLPPHAQALLDACAAAGPGSTLDRLIARIPHHPLSELADALERRLGLRETDLPPATRLMQWDDLRALQAGGVEVGGHTVNHVALANVPFARARAEIRGCREQIAAAMGEPPRHFAYPNGYYTARIRQAVAEAGFATAVTTEDTENRHAGDPLTLKRKTVWENSTMGARRYSSALAACNLDGVFGALGWQRPVSGERPDRPEPEEAAVAAVERVAG